MAKNRNIQTLIKVWENIQNDDELVRVIDSMTMAEAKLLEQAIQKGQVNREPNYMLQETAK